MRSNLSNERSVPAAQSEPECTPLFGRRTVARTIHGMNVKKKKKKKKKNAAESLFSIGQEAKAAGAPVGQGIIGD